MRNHADTIETRPTQAADLTAIGALHARAFGPGRFARTAYRVREGVGDLSRHCRTAWHEDVLIGAVTMTGIMIGTETGHWLLGPLAVRSGDTNKGLARRLVSDALTSIADLERPEATVILVGDLAYYERFHFEVAPRGEIAMPGPVAPERLLIWRGPDGTRDVPSGLVKASKPT